MPTGDALKHGMGVGAQKPRQAADGFAVPRIALVGHGAGAGLAGGEALLNLQYFSALEIAKLGGDALQPGSQQS